jgi:hypothetical protein
MPTVSELDVTRVTLHPISTVSNDQRALRRIRSQASNMIISSQRYIDDEIVASKVAAEDFAVLLSPVFAYEGGEYQVVLDGHHSLAAAAEAGIDPSYSIADASQHDAIGLLRDSNVEDFLLVTHMGNDYYDVATGQDVW